MLTLDDEELRRRGQLHLCLTCAAPLPDDAQPKRTYCDDRCKRRLARAEAKARAGDTRTGTCQHCGERFTEPRKRGPVSSYCSARCKRRAQHRREYLPRQRHKRYKHDVGAQFGQLTITERLEGGRAVVSCQCGTQGKVVHVRNMVAGLTSHCAGAPHRSRTEAPSYSGAHSRVRAARGPAKAHQCILCRERSARDWAYRHGDLGQLIEAAGREAGAPYSVEPEHYWPMCRPCHQRWDEAQRRQAPPGAMSLPHVALSMAV